jgi:hypothetical protein
LKLPKPGIPILPVISNMKAPVYKISKHLVRMLSKDLTFNNHYNVVNSTNLANELTKLKTNENHKLITYDIKDLYVNIPIEETLTFSSTMAEIFLQNLEDMHIKQLLGAKNILFHTRYVDDILIIYDTKNNTP